MAKKYYSVYKGKSGSPKIFTTWDECKAEVHGCKGAIYKSFPTEQEAIEFLRLNSQGKPLNKKEEETENVEGLQIYVDGSFSLEKENYSYGLVAILDGEVIYEDKGIGTDENAIALRNVSGEVMGAIKAVEYAINNNHKEVNIYFDYQGIESWALGTWKRNNNITASYHSFMQEKMKQIIVKFRKVKGHSGDKYNDRADVLAKEALGI
ncbi:MAG: viroplasmin family protein [Clostridium sp.]